MTRLLAVLLLAGAAWRVYLALPLVDVDASLLSFALGVLPYGVVAGLGREARVRAVAVPCAFAALTIDVATGFAAMRATSSTGAIAVLLAPLASALGAALVLVASHVLSRKS